MSDGEKMELFELSMLGYLKHDIEAWKEGL